MGKLKAAIQELIGSGGEAGPACRELVIPMLQSSFSSMITANVEAGNASTKLGNLVTLFVSGTGLTQRLLNGELLRGGDFSSLGDHRMAMALRVASLGADGPVRIDDEACVAKSFPDFFPVFSSLLRK